MYAAHCLKKQINYSQDALLWTVVSYDELSDTVDVRIFDLFGCRQYYEYAFKEFTFDAKKVRRCSAPIGSMVKVANEIGIVEAVMKSRMTMGNSAIMFVFKMVI